MSRGHAQLIWCKFRVNHSVALSGPASGRDEMSACWHEVQSVGGTGHGASSLTVNAQDMRCR